MHEIEDHIYDYPLYYDLIFAAEWKQEFNFLNSVFKKYATGKVKNLFEPACGTGRLIYRFAHAGYSITGNDLNEKAIAFCNQRLVRHGLKPTGIVGDMTKFSITKPVDAAFNTINSFRHLQTERAAIDHLNCMADAIRPGGVYVLGFHLTPTLGDACEEEYWTARRGRLTVDSGMWLLERNRRQRFESFGMSFDVTTPKEKFRIVDEVKFRTYTLPQFQKLLNQVPRFEMLAVFDFDYDIDVPIGLNGETEDVLFVLGRQ